MIYNLCHFLGNKAFVIDFLETGLLCCVYLRPTGKELSGQNLFPSPEFRRAFIQVYLVCLYTFSFSDHNSGTPGPICLKFW